MSAENHTVSKFHLRFFEDPLSVSQRDPWLWVGDIATGNVKRRAAKNLGVKHMLYEGPGGLENRDKTIERYLSEYVEGPASKALREIETLEPGSTVQIAQPLMTYLAWAAARCLPMKQLYEDWMLWYSSALKHEIIEPPLEGLVNASDPMRDLAMIHPGQGQRTWPYGSDFDQLIASGWILDIDDNSNYLELVHIQAYYLGARFFPRLTWHLLRPPTGQHFIIGDRPVGWITGDRMIDTPPCYLREEGTYVIAPLAKDLVLIGHHPSRGLLNVTPSEINKIIACLAQEWIAGPTKTAVESALQARQVAFRLNCPINQENLF